MHSCGGHFASPSVHQTITELEFERGIWSSALNGDVADVKRHLDKGVSPNVTDNSGYTALHYACRHGKEDVCELLLNHGADTNSMTKSGRVTPLHRAAYKGSDRIVSLLLKYRADPKIQDSDGKTALHKAAEERHVTVIETLVISCPACVNIVDSKNKKAADYVSEDRKDILKLMSDQECTHGGSVT